MDIFEKLLQNLGPIGQHSDRAHGYFAFPKLEGEIGSRMKFRGKEKIVWSLNNYLGLANHPEVRQADAEAAKVWGLATPMGARMMSGSTDLHDQLENELSAFVKKEDTILLNYGYQGIMSCIDALVGRHDVIVYDAECHASIIDGLRLHPGQQRPGATEHPLAENVIREIEEEAPGVVALLGDDPAGAIRRDARLLGVSMNMLRLSPTVAVHLSVAAPAPPDPAGLLAPAEFAEAVLVEATPAGLEDLWRNEPLLAPPAAGSLALWEARAGIDRAYL